jgi:molybdate-binding protein
VIAAGIHLHRLTDNDERANVETVLQTPGLHDAVVIAFARREQGLLVAPGNKLKLIDIASVVHKKARMAQRQPGAGAQLLLLRLLNSAGLSPDAVTKTEPEFATGPDLAHAVRGGRADCGIAPRSAAREAGLDFVPLVWERFDLVLRQRDYFRPGPQALLTFMRSAAFAERAAELSGYDTTDSGAVRQLS